jgi:hypothetical protein
MMQWAETNVFFPQLLLRPASAILTPFHSIQVIENTHSAEKERERERVREREKEKEREGEREKEREKKERTRERERGGERGRRKGRRREEKKRERKRSKKEEREREKVNTDWFSQSQKEGSIACKNAEGKN